MPIKQEIVLPDYPLDEARLDSIVRKSLGTCPKELADDVSNYIIRQFNQESFKGVVKHGQLEIILVNATDGLFNIVHMKHWNIDLEDKDPVFMSAFNLMAMLMTRIYEGKDYNMALKEQEAKIVYGLATRQQM